VEVAALALFLLATGSAVALLWWVLWRYVLASVFGGLSSRRRGVVVAVILALAIAPIVLAALDVGDQLALAALIAVLAIVGLAGALAGGPGMKRASNRDGSRQRE